MSFTSYDVAESAELGRSAATVLSYIRRWLPYARVTRDGVPWVWRTLEQIAEDLGLSKRTVQRAIALLVKKGLLLKEKLWKHRWRQVMFYSLPDFLQPSRPEQADVPEEVTMATSVNNVPKGQHPPAKQLNDSKKRTKQPDFKALARQAARRVAKAVGFSTPNPPPLPPSGTCLVNGHLCLSSDWPLSLELDKDPPHVSPNPHSLTL